MTTPTNEAGHGLPELPFPFEIELYAEPDGMIEIRVFTLTDEGDPSRRLVHNELVLPPEPRIRTAAPAAAGAQGEDWFGDVLASAGEVIPMKPETLSDAALIAGWEAKAAAYDKLGPEEDGGDPTGDKAKTLRNCAAELRSRISLQLAPQPAAADGGVRERARALFDAMLAAPYGSTTMGDIVCAETTCNRLESAWLPILEADLSSHRQAGEPDDVEKSVSVLRVLHQGSADDMAKAGREDLANVHYDAIRLLDYALDLHRQNVSMPNSENSEYKPWAKAIDELAWVIGELEYIEGVKAIKSSEIPDYISRKAAWRESCEALVKEHGRALLTPPPGADLSKFRELAEMWLAEDVRRHSAPTELSGCADDLIALVEKGAGNAD